jgi:hypothetical protein
MKTQELTMKAYDTPSQCETVNEKESAIDKRSYHCVACSFDLVAFVCVRHALQHTK